MLAALIASIASCTRPDPPPPVSDTPRLVVLSPALAIILRDAGCEHLIVARHAYDMVLDPAIPVCGDQGSIEYETLLRVRPTHVLTQLGQDHIPARLRALADEQGFELIDRPTLTLDNIVAVANELQARFAPDAAEPLGDRLLASIRRRPPATLFAGRVLLLHQTSPASALGPGSFHDQVLTRIGGVDALTAGSPYQELALEDIARLAPDAIVLIQPRRARTPASPAPDWPALRARLGPIADLPIPAISNRRVALIDDPLALTPSTALIDLADELAAILTRWHANNGS